MKRFIAWLTKRRESRTVLLTDGDGEITISKAFHTQAGWYAKRFSKTVKLLPDGKTSGVSYVNTWLPHGGWPEEEAREGVK